MPYMHMDSTKLTYWVIIVIKRHDFGRESRDMLGEYVMGNLGGEGGE